MQKNSQHSCNLSSVHGENTDRNKLKIINIYYHTECSFFSFLTLCSSRIYKENQSISVCERKSHLNANQEENKSPDGHKRICLYIMGMSQQTLLNTYLNTCMYSEKLIKQRFKMGAAAIAQEKQGQDNQNCKEDPHPRLHPSLTAVAKRQRDGFYLGLLCELR